MINLEKGWAAGSYLAIDPHIHLGERGGVRSAKEAVLAARFSQRTINGLAVCSFAYLHPWVLFQLQKEVTPYHMVALPAAELSVAGWGHIEVLPRPDSIVSMAEFSQDVQKYKFGVNDPYDMAKRMDEDYHAILNIVHGNPKGRFAGWVAGLDADHIKEFVMGLRDRGNTMPVLVEEYSGERDLLLDQANQVGIQQLQDLNDWFITNKMGVGRAAGSDDRGFSLGYYRTGWVTTRGVYTDVDLYDSLYEATAQGRTFAEQWRPAMSKLEQIMAIALIGLNHITPRAEFLLYHTTDVLLEGRLANIPLGLVKGVLDWADVTRRYLQISKQISDDGDRWIDEFRRHKKLEFDEIYSIIG